MTPDLVEIAATRLRLWDAGYRPVAVYSHDHADRERAGKAPLGTAWTERARRDPPECVTLPAVAHATNTGLLCDGLRVIDVDVDDPALAGHVRARIIAAFGDGVPIRYRENSGRCAALLRAASGSPGKRVLAGRLGKVEVLGRGQQVVTHGIHPSGAALNWYPEAPEQIACDALRAVSEEEINGLLQAVAQLIEADPPTEEHAQDHTSADPQADPLRVAAALARIGNTGIPDWEWWNRVGMAVWRATGGSSAGWEAWNAWSARNDAYDPDATRARWDHYATSPPTSIGAGTLFHMAAEACAGPRTNRRATGDAVSPPMPEWMASSSEAEAAAVEGGARTDEPAQIPTIRCRAGELPRMLREAEAALLNAGAPIYQRGILVRPSEVEYAAADDRKTHSASLIAITPPAMLKMLASAAIWMKWDGRARAFVVCDPPSKVVDILLASRGDWRFPVVRGVLTTPTLRPDGSLLVQPGYDPASRYYLLFPSDLVLPAIPDKPTRADALESLARLDALLDSFPFVEDDGVSRSVALAMLMTQPLRCAMPVSPLLAASATAPNSGKSYLVDLASSIAIGRPCPVMEPGKSDEETEKGINTMLISGVAGFSIDNVHKMIDLPVLNIATERPLIAIRLFGTLTNIEVENAVTIYMTGNNLGIVDEQMRRTLRCNMDAKVERPELRNFTGDPIKAALSARGRYLADILIIARAYLTNGTRPGIPPIGSYGAWSRFVREPLVWLSRADPVKSMEKLRDDDPETIRRHAIMTAWYFAFGLEAKTLADAARFASTPPISPGEYADPDELHAYHEARNKQEGLRDVLREAFAGQRDGVDTAKWGYWMRKYAGRFANGLRFVQDKGHTGGAVRWKLSSS